MRKAIYAALSVLVFAFCGCSSGNDSNTILDASGKHPSGWVVQSNGGTHPGFYISLPERCVECHGSDLKGGVSNVSCFSSSFNGFVCHPQGPGHPPGWAAPEQHGAKAKAPVGGSSGMGFCRNCHGPDYQGAGQVPSCLNCHGAPSPHPQATKWRSAASPPQVPYTHTNTDTSNAQACSQCHNATTKNLAQPYQDRFVPAGSFNNSAPGCYNGSMCHANIIATSNCDVCHGIQASGVFSSLSGITTQTNSKAGAHSKHFAPTISSSIACQQCHPVPATYQQSGLHRNSTTNFSFGSLATNNGALTPAVTLSASGYSCTNTYCHGVTLTGGGSNKTPRWNDTAYNNGCGTCHGYPPSTYNNGSSTHSTSTNCSGCHPDVNSSNNGFTPSGVAQHINGSVEATGGGHAFPYSGAVHRPGGSGNPLANAAAPYTNCSGCHDTTTLNGIYPVASGVKPLCSACHLNMTLFTGATPGCWDCHGASATDGRPNGSSFPNRQGSANGHNRSTHRIACTSCHPITTGSTAHGWSNNAPKSTNAQVVTELFWNPGTRGTGQGSCLPSAGFNGCHGFQQGWY